MRSGTAEERRSWRRHWIGDPLTGARLLATHELLRLVPTDALSGIGAGLASFAGPRLHARADARARAALRLLRPDLADDSAGLDAAMKRFWRSLGRVYAEFSAEDRLWDEGRVTVEGAHHLASATEGGRPLLVAGVHLGNWELLPITLGYLGRKVIDVYQPQRNRFENLIANRARMRIAGRIHRSVPSHREIAMKDMFRLVPPTARAGAELLKGLKDGCTLMMFVDEQTRGAVHAPRFGRPLKLDGNLGRVIRLARMVDGAVAPAFVERRPEGARFTVHFLPPLELRSTGDAKTDFATNVRALDQAVTPLILERIEQWYMLMDYRHDR